jgi:hypothetical protein
MNRVQLVDDFRYRRQQTAKHFRFKKLCAFAFAANIIKWKELKISK